MAGTFYIVTDGDAKLFSSINGGQSVTELYDFTTNFSETGLHCVCVVNNNIILVGTMESGKIYKSIDGGSSFSLVATLPCRHVWDIISYGNGICLATVYHSTYECVYRSTDYGDTWSLVRGITTTTFTDGYQIGYNSSGYALVGPATSSFLGRVDLSSNYGAYGQWRVFLDPSYVGHVYALTLFDNGIALASGYYDAANPGKIFRSDDIREDDVWSYLGLIPYPLYKFTHSNDGIVLVSTWSTGGHIYRSTDYGDSWSDVLDPGENSFFGIKKSSSGEVLAGTNSGKLYRSSDHGLTFDEYIDIGESTIMDIDILKDNIPNNIFYGAGF